MKLRIGFVSNSSSSSFIIAKKPTTPSTVKITLEVDFSKYSKEIVKDADGLLQLAKDYDLDTEEVAKYQELLAKGYEIHKGWFDDQSGDPIELFLCMNGIPRNISKRIKIIQNEGGY